MNLSHLNVYNSSRFEMYSAAGTIVHWIDVIIDLINDLICLECLITYAVC